ncbi:hypothetical protein CI109_105773 [Kwoniella shandongensis]|uniref:Golgi apparatus membrane protein TVP38 n=1 Tax=Kwoniella shandongensis TaxID=1734106 RepID=A0A5M6C1U2_9TREE|nr:uncharacterized protein CI109_003112 [Kwoniella shandongensis]KAA5528580.1 hypothetical protein CI109_003112 [Kwoniella shandongensis]
MPRLETSPSSSTMDLPLSHRARTLFHRLRALPRETLHRYHKLGRKGKATIWVITAVHIFFLALIVIITPTRIGHWFTSLALKIKGMGWKGVLLCMLFNILSSHPPLFGFVGSLTLIGFTYGVWPGFLIAFIGSMAGAGIAFLSVRAFFLGFIGRNDKWDAFGHVMRSKGLPLVIMIRYCPIPWAVGNGLFASIESVKFWQFMLATLCIQPRLFIPVFIGSRLTSLASDSPSSDPLRFWLNLFSIGLSGAISVTTGIVIYRLTLEQMRKLDREGGSGQGFGDGELAAEVLEQDALLGEYNDSGSDADEAEMLTEREGRGGLGVGRGGAKLARRTSGSDAGDMA